jgi:hypothetical protein
MKKKGLLGLVWVIFSIREERGKDLQAKILFVPDAVSPPLNYPNLIV